MAKKADFRKCQYSHCKHDDKTISIATEEYAEENGRYYITTCGWRDKPVPHNGCVSIAELDWK